MAILQELLIYDRDDVTLLTSCTTDPAGTRPHLHFTEQGPLFEVDILRGSASVSKVNVRLVDNPTNPLDQGTGWFTAVLADIGGQSQLAGHRIVLRENRNGAGWKIVQEGICGDVSLDSGTYVTYQVALKDIGERVRTLRAFVRSGTSAVLPRGVLNGYGKPEGVTDPTKWLIPPVTPLVGEFDFYGTDAGYFFPDLGIKKAGDKVDAQVIVAEKARAAMTPEPAQIGDAWASVYKKVAVFWRDEGSSDPWTELYDIDAAQNTVYNNSGILCYLLPGKFRRSDGSTVDVSACSTIFMQGDVGDLPSASQRIEVVVMYVGEPSKDYPWHFEGTAGELVAALYDGEAGDPADTPNRIRYDAAAVAALATRAPLRVTEPEDDLRDWLEKNIYQPLGAAPALNEDGEIAPVLHNLPSSTAGLSVVDDTNTEPDADWMHGTSDAVNMLTFAYWRDFVAPTDSDPEGNAAGDTIVEQKVQLGWPAPSIGLIGAKPLAIETVAFRAIGGRNDSPADPDMTNELGAHLALERRFETFDRVSYGAQRIHARCHRNDADIEAAKVGDWVIVGLSWLPDYRTGERGQSRLAQIVSRQVLSPTLVAFQLLDGGPNLAGLGLPTLSGATAAADGVVTATISAIPAGVEARLDYAVNATEPPASSGLWNFMGRIAVAGDVTSPPLPAGSVVWVRARGEAGGRVRSGWTTSVTATVPSTPRVTALTVVIDQKTGAVTVTWVVNAYTAGLKLFYQSHDPDVDPNPTLNVSVDAATGTHTFATGSAVAGEQFTVDAEPWSGWTGSAVSGTAGPIRRASDQRATTQPPSGLVLTSNAGTALATQGGQYVPRIKVEWTASPDELLDRYEIEWKKSADSIWIAAPAVAKEQVSTFIGPVTDGVAHDVRVRALNIASVPSAWITGTVTAGTQAGSSSATPRPPAITIVVPQSASPRTVQVGIDDPDLTVTDVLFQKKIGAGNFSALAGTWDTITGTAGVDDFLFREEDVDLDPKHNSEFILEVTYNLGGASMTETRHVTIDVDTIAEIDLWDLDFEDDGTPKAANIEGDDDTDHVYITVGIGSSPLDPTNVSNDGSLVGNAGEIVSTGSAASAGDTVYMKIVGYNSGVPGPVSEKVKVWTGYPTAVTGVFVTGGTNGTNDTTNQALNSVQWTAVGPAGAYIMVESYGKTDTVADGVYQEITDSPLGPFGLNDNTDVRLGGFKDSSGNLYWTFKHRVVLYNVADEEKASGLDTETRLLHVTV